jgi:hypothetical protein
MTYLNVGFTIVKQINTEGSNLLKKILTFCFYAQFDDGTETISDRLLPDSNAENQPLSGF